MVATSVVILLLDSAGCPPSFDARDRDHCLFQATMEPFATAGGFYGLACIDVACDIDSEYGLAVSGDTPLRRAGQRASERPASSAWSCRCLWAEGTDMRA